jgi:hypothetical protein
MTGIAGFNTLGRQLTLQTQLLYCRSSLMCALLGIAFRHCDFRPYPARHLFVGISQKEII